MVRSSSSLKTPSFFLRKHRRWPHSPYKARWHIMFSQQQAMQSFKQAAAEAAVQETPNNHHLPPNLLSSLIDSFKMYNCEPTPQAYHFLIKTLTKTSQLQSLPSVLHHLEKAENFQVPESIFIHLIEIYGNANEFQKAVDLFYSIPKFRCVPSVHSLNSLLSVLCRNSKGLKLAHEVLLRSQVMNIRVEQSTFDVLISALCRIRKVGYAIEMLNCMVNDGFSLDGKTCSLLLSSLCEQENFGGIEVLKCLEELRKLGFRLGMLDYCNVMRFLVKEQKSMEALGVLDEMRSNGINPDIVCYNILLKGVVGSGDFSKAEDLFDELLLVGLVPDICTYNVYINGLCEQNNVEEGIKIAAGMEELGCKPNVVTYNMLVKQLYKVGEISRANELFRQMGLKGIGVNKETYRIMINGLASHNRIIEASALLEEVLDKDLCACSFSYDEIISGLCQKDLIDKALRLLRKMAERNVPPSARVWKALLSYGSKVEFVETSFLGLVET